MIEPGIKDSKAVKQWWRKKTSTLFTSICTFYKVFKEQNGNENKNWGYLIYLWNWALILFYSTGGWLGPNLKKDLKIVTVDVPSDILPAGWTGQLLDGKVFSRRGPDDAIYDGNIDIRNRVRFGKLNKIGYEYELTLNISIHTSLHVSLKMPTYLY